ncbi:MAG: YqaJ-like viral recombinase [Parcubacteria group bacterium]|nr:YqaJ-like viral recombinase [Parcubacteria group bacterium]|tara:strand:+ start:33828 stop:34469 length:642 start_codon:yes stop_codon:yes gene_type:complete
MVKFHDIKQNTDYWHQLRCGKVTASQIGKIMVNYPKAFSDPAKRYATQIALEQITCKPCSDNYSNSEMDRGHEEEPIARKLYEDENFINVSNGGFFEDGDCGVSPDGLVDTNGLIEIKAQKFNIHYDTVRKATPNSTYNWQYRFLLKVTGREWLDFVSYCSTFPKGKQLFTYRMYAKDMKENFKKIDDRLAQFFKLVEKTKQTILESKYDYRG